MTAAANQQCDVGTLASSIRVKFIKNEKTEALGSVYKCTVFPAGKEQFQHHVVREKNVGGVIPHGLPFRGFLLPCVAGEPDRGLAFGIALHKKFFKLINLTVCQSIHWIDNNCLNALF